MNSKSVTCDSGVVITEVDFDRLKHLLESVFERRIPETETGSAQPDI